MKRIISTAVVTGAVLGLGACKSKPPEELPPPPYVAPPPTDNGGAGAGYGGGQVAGVGTQQHFSEAVNGQTVVYFDTDRYNIDSQDAAILQAQAQYLMRNPSVRVTIEGHTDERGTRDYNLALGERRANSAKNYLVSVGVPAARISTVSYGKERPVALGSSESAWAQNRRAVTMVVN